METDTQLPSTPIPGTITQPLRMQWLVLGQMQVGTTFLLQLCLLQWSNPTFFANLDDIVLSLPVLLFLFFFEWVETS